MILEYQIPKEGGKGWGRAAVLRGSPFTYSPGDSFCRNHSISVTFSSIVELKMPSQKRYFRKSTRQRRVNTTDK